MTHEEARMRARHHLDDRPLDHPDYRWRLSDGVELPSGWYFDYVFEPLRPIPEAEWEQFAGAPGFFVPSDGSAVHDVSWDEYTEREISTSSSASTSTPNGSCRSS